MALSTWLFIFTLHCIANIISASIISCNESSSCSNTIINCSLNTNCSILCNATSSCTNLTINSAANHSLSIDCIANHSCSNLQINGKYASNVDFKGCTVSNSCKHINLYCPKQCHLQVNTINNLNIYAKNGWKDVYTPNHRISSQIMNSSIHCNAYYNDSCLILSDWSCYDNECNESTPYHTIYSKTQPLNNRHLWIVVLGIAIAFLLICICTSLYGTIKEDILKNIHRNETVRQSTNSFSQDNEQNIDVDVMRKYSEVTEYSKTVRIHGTPLYDPTSPSLDIPKAKPSKAKRIELEVVNENPYKSANAKRLSKFNDALIVQTVTNVSSPITPPNDSVPASYGHVLC